MIDHFNLPVSDLAKSRAFYELILMPLGYRFLMQDGAAVGFGSASWLFGLIATKPPFPELHVAFIANSRPAVDQFHRAALAAGARSNGAPGVRRQYDPDYYAAYILDPDGHNVEAVCRSASALS
jgi:catechol 2,3-dioxygenase-like lactoylglutathione lyase family enzyme